MEYLKRFAIFSLLLTGYVLVIVIVTPILPYVLLILLLAWLVIRQPMSYPGRMDSDIKLIGNKTGEAVIKLIEFLTRPLKNFPKI